MKRTFDVVAATLGLLVAAPVIFVLALIIRFESPGPGIFSQNRVGRSGRLFRCHKLRTMQTGSPDVPTHQISTNLVTPIGRFLRKAKLDELPQLWNVFKGDMSLVGPRPCLPSQTDLIEERRKRGVLSLRPGITGLAQIRGIDMSVPERLAKVDARYLATQSPALDCWIMLRTIFGGKGRNEQA